jgi:hypothetical protein
VADIANWLSLVVGNDRGIEIRAPGHKIPGVNGPPVNTVRRFAPGEFSRAAAAALGISGNAPAVYVVMNGIDPSLIRAKTRGGAKAEDIPSRRRILIDCDPVRPGETNATDEEKAEAFRVAKEVRSHLKVLGWPDPVEADSGNGAHLVYAIDLANDDESNALVKSVLASVAAKFDNARVKIDPKVHDAPRLIKIPGTLAAKGQNTDGRPHRYARVLTAPARLEPVPTELLRSLATEAPAAPQGVSEPKTQTATNGKGNGATVHPADVEARAIAYLETCDPAISGQKGHDKAFKAACKIGPGFDLPTDVAFRLLWVHFNPRCVPTWSERELRHKVDDAYAKEPRRGWLRDAPPKNGRHSLRLVSPETSDPEAGRSSEAQTDNRPEIIITTERHEVVDQAVAALSNDTRIYQRTHTLVAVRRDSAPGRGFTRPPGSPVIAELPLATLGERLTENAAWYKPRKTRDGETEAIPAHPPDWAIAAVAARGEWPNIRQLEAVIEAPVLRPDGSILDTAGYDELTGLLYEPGGDFLPVPINPSQEDARRAADELLDLVVDFPFACPYDKAAWLSGALTPLARFAIPGPCPFFMVEANVAGSGKSKLCDLSSIISTGRPMPRTDYPDDNEEMRKCITAIALAGDRTMLLDNIAVTFGGSALDGALTGQSWRGRILGLSKMTPELPLFTIWYGTGNNVTFRGDAVRRIVQCRLESLEERPEERSGFKILGDLLKHALENRPRLVQAALTILRAYHVAGRPKQNLTPMDFVAWSDLVRESIFWATGLDPCAGKRRILESDPNTMERISLINGWAELPNSEFGVTVAEALRQLKDDQNAGRYGTLRNVLLEWSRNGDLPGAKATSMKLNAMKGRVIDGKMIVPKDAGKGTKAWRVVSAMLPNEGGTSGTSGTRNLSTREICADSCNTKNGGDAVKTSHQSHQSHQGGVGRVYEV